MMIHNYPPFVSPSLKKKKKISSLSSPSSSSSSSFFLQPAPKRETTMKKKEKKVTFTLLYIKRRRRIIVLSLIICIISWLIIIIIRQLISFDKQQQQHNDEYLFLLENQHHHQQQQQQVYSSSSSHRTSASASAGAGAGGDVVPTEAEELIPPPLPKRREEYTIHGEYGDYIVIDPTRVKRYIMNRYYNDSLTTMMMKEDHYHHHQIMSMSSSSSTSSTTTTITNFLDSYLTFDDIKERQQVCNHGNNTTATTTTNVNDDAAAAAAAVAAASYTLSLLYNKIQVNGPDQGFYHITRTKTTDKNLRTHLLQNVTTTTPTPTTISSKKKKKHYSVNDNEHEHEHKQPIRILCAIYTYHERNDMITAVSQTWGWKCDGFFAASTRNILSDDNDYDDNNNSHQHQPPGYGSIKLPHKGKESYGNMWQKTRSILQYMYKHYLDEYDFFYLCGDDVHVIVENLKATIKSIPGRRAYEQPLFMGNWIPLSKNQQMKSRIKLIPFVDGDYFVCGGPGYVINKLTLKLLVENILPTCHTNIKSSTEDILISDCLKRYNIYGNNTVDSNGGQRFDSSPKKLDQFTQGLLLALSTTTDQNTIPEYWMNAIKFWTYHFSTGNNSYSNIQKYHLYNRISSQVIALHGFKSPLELKQHHAKLYNSCAGGTTK